MSDEADRPRADDATATEPGVAGATGEPTDPPAPETDPATPEPSVRPEVLTTGATTVIARTIARTVAPVVILTAVALTVRGHNLPGGGFIGGVLTAIAFVLLYVVYSADHVRTNLLPEDGGRHPAQAMFAIGLALALFSGLVPVALGGSFLTQGYLILPEPLPGPFYHDFEVATALAFDVGVYLVIVGGLLTIVREVGEE